MARTYTKQAMALVEQQFGLAKRQNLNLVFRGFVFTAKGRIFSHGGGRVGIEATVQAIAHQLDVEGAAVAIKQPKRTGFAWDDLNQATKDLFFNLCEQIQTVSRDHSMIVPVLIKELQIGLKHAPRLSNLKKAGLFVGHIGLKKSHKMLRLTDHGLAIWATYAG